jgi:hypothetical protein
LEIVSDGGGQFHVAVEQAKQRVTSRRQTAQYRSKGSQREHIHQKTKKIGGYAIPLCDYLNCDAQQPRRDGSNEDGSNDGSVREQRRLVRV